MNTPKNNPELQEPMTSNHDEPDPAAAPATGSGKKSKARVPRGTPNDLQVRQAVIGNELRRMFEQVVNEPVPPEMLELLQRIEKQAD